MCWPNLLEVAFSKKAISQNCSVHWLSGKRTHPQPHSTPLMYTILVSSPVLEANTVVNVRTVVIKMLHTSVTYPTVLCAQWSHQSTRVTEIF